MVPRCCAVTGAAQTNAAKHSMTDLTFMNSPVESTMRERGWNRTDVRFQRTLALWQGDDVVGAQRDRTVPGERASDEVGVVDERDARQGDDVALPLRARADGGRAADLPVHVLRLRAIDQDHVARRRQAAAGLEDERRVRIAAAIER